MKIANIKTNDKVGEEVQLAGWIHTLRKMGKIVFVDLRDRSGLVQVVLVPSELDQESQELMKQLKPEAVIKVVGLVQPRGQKQVNANLATGSVEVLAKHLNIFSESLTPPFEIVNEDRQANEELRLKYRYLDLRHERMKNNILLRHEIIRFIREYFYALDFTEVETPYISKSTPEGARDFLVPSRNFSGKFYALPQSPQQYKQLLMVAGLEKYFQVVRCFRDEDQRGDRQAEFTQLDVEMSFITQEGILQMIEELFTQLVKKLLPNKKFTSQPFTRLTYQQAMEQYGSDRPDLRQDKTDPDELAFVWVTDFPMFEYKSGDQRWGAAHHPFTAINPQDLEKLKDPKKMGEIKALQYDLVLNGYEIAGGSIRTHESSVLHRVFELLGHTDEEIQAKFGHLLEAFKYGVPPHGGIAAGLDRVVMVLANEPSIREVIAFPKTSDNRDPLMDSPSDVTKDQLDELGLSLKK